MKNKRFLFAALFAAVMGMVACEKENELPQLPDGTDVPETYTISLACGGELGMDVTYDPLSRTDADANDLYGVQVRYTNESGVTKPYAYGLFDDPSKMTLTLLSKHSYEFAIVLIKDGKNVIYSDSIAIAGDNVKNDIGYGYPLRTYDSNASGSSKYKLTPVKNQFFISENDYLFIKNSSRLDIENRDGSIDYYGYDLDYYYGSTSGFTPTANNAEISVYMKRMVYGLKIEAGDFLTEGFLNLKINGSTEESWKKAYFSYILRPDNKIVEYTYAYHNPSSWYVQQSLEDASITRTIREICWYKNDSTEIKLTPSNKDVKFYRKKQTFIKIDYTPEDYESDEYTGNSVAISLEAPDIIGGANYNFTDKNSKVEW